MKGANRGFPPNVILARDTQCREALCELVAGPRLGGRGDVRRGGDAGGFSQTVIPAKGEARVSGLGRWDEKAQSRNARAEQLHLVQAVEWTPARWPG